MIGRNPPEIPIGIPQMQPMKVIEAEQVDANRWMYKCKSMRFNPDTGLVSEQVNPFELPRPCVWNICEINNNATTAMGITVANLPGDFELKPVPIDTIVPVWLTMFESKYTGFLIWPNQFDGDCDG